MAARPSLFSCGSKTPKTPDVSERLTEEMVQNSRRSIKAEHKRLNAKYRELKVQNEFMKDIFRELKISYQEMQDSFPLNRILKLKQAVQNASSDDNLNKVSIWLEQAQVESVTCPFFLEQVQRVTLKLQATGDEKRDPKGHLINEKDKKLKSHKKKNKLLRKVQKMTGFDSNKPLEDEDIMTNEELLKDIDLRRRIIRRYAEGFAKALKALTSLRHVYDESMSQCFLKRHFILKEKVEMIINQNIEGEYVKFEL